MSDIEPQHSWDRPALSRAPEQRRVPLEWIREDDLRLAAARVTIIQSTTRRLAVAAAMEDFTYERVLVLSAVRL